MSGIVEQRAAPLELGEAGDLRPTTENLVLKSTCCPLHVVPVKSLGTDEINQCAE